MDTGDTASFPDSASSKAAGTYVMQYGLINHGGDISQIEEKLNFARAKEKLLFEELNQQKGIVNEQAKELTKYGAAIQTLKKEKVLLKHEVDVKCCENMELKRQLEKLKTKFELVSKENQLMKTRDQMHEVLLVEVNQLKEKLASVMEERNQLMQQIDSLQLRGSEKAREELDALKVKFAEYADRERKLAAREIVVQAAETRVMQFEEVMTHVHEIDGELQRLQTENKDLRTKLHQKLAKTDKVGAQSLKNYQDKMEEMYKFNLKSQMKITELEAQLFRLGNPNSTVSKPTVASRGKSCRPTTAVTGSSVETKDHLKSNSK